MANYIDLPELQDASEFVRRPYLSALAKGGNDLDLLGLANSNIKFVSQRKRAAEYIIEEGYPTGLLKSYTERNADDTASKTYTWVGTLRGGRPMLTAWSNTGTISADDTEYKNVVLTTPEGVIVFARRYYRTLGSDGTYSYGTISGSTTITEDEVTETPEERLDALISQSWEVLEPSDPGSPELFDDSLGSVGIGITWRDGLNRDSYYDAVVPSEVEIWDEDASLVFDQDGWDAAIQDRVDALDSQIQSEQSRLTADQNSLSQKEAELLDLQNNEEARNVAAWQQDVDDTLAITVEYGELVAQKNQKLIELQGDLTDEERDQLQQEIYDLQDQMDAILFGDYGAGFIDSASQAILSKQRGIALQQSRIAVHQAIISSLEACKAGIQASPTEDNYYLTYADGSFNNVAADYYDDRDYDPSTDEWENEGRTKMAGRYKILVEGPAALRAASEVDVRWAETTQPDNIGSSQGIWKPNPTRNYKQTTLSLAAGENEVSSPWYVIDAPLLGISSVTVGTPFLGQPATDQILNGVEVRKDGIYGYLPSQPPKVYRKEVWSGGHNGCPASDLEPVDYAWEKGALTPEEQEDLGDEPNPPRYKSQPRTLGFTWSTYDPLMDGSRLPNNTMDARTWLDSTFKCGEGDEATDVQHTFETELQEELTADKLKIIADEYNADYSTWYEAWILGDVSFLDRPIPGDYAPEGYLAFRGADFPTREIFNQLLNGRVAGSTSFLSSRSRGAVKALNYLSSDETLYLKKSTKWRSALHGDRASLPDASLVLKFTQVTLNLETNEITEIQQSRTITAVQDPEDNPPFDYYFQMPYELLEAPEQCFVILADFYVDIDESNWGTANSVYDDQVLSVGGSPEIIDARTTVTDP